MLLQQNVPVAFYSCNLSCRQQNYTTTIDKELLSVVNTLRTFSSMLLGAVIHTHSDNRNLTYDIFTTQQAYVGIYSLKNLILLFISLKDWTI